MPRFEIHHSTDPRLAPYRNLRDRVLRRQGGRFIAESEKVVQRLLASNLDVESVLVQVDRYAALASSIADDVPVYLVTPDLMADIAGFSIHTGVLAIGLRPQAVSLDELIIQSGDRPFTLVICSGLKEAVNVGSLMRSCAALGADALVLDATCCDAWYRRAVRVSMGAVFRVPVMHSDDLAGDLRWLADRHGVAGYAAVLDEQATPLHNLADRPQRVAIVLGHEVDGLASSIIDACSGKVTIPMQPHSDSLNVAVSGAICLHHFTRVAKWVDQEKTP